MSDVPSVEKLRRLISGDGYTDDELIDVLLHLTIDEEGEDTRVSTAVLRRWLLCRQMLREACDRIESARHEKDGPCSSCCPGDTAPEEWREAADR